MSVRRNELDAVLRDTAEKITNSCINPMPERVELCLIGGGALGHYGYREIITDIDIVSSIDISSAVADVNEMYQARGLSDEFQLDATTSTYAWDEVDYPDLMTHANKVATFSFNNVEIVFKAPTLETLFLMKVHYSREKDLKDIANLVHALDPDAVAERLNALIKVSTQDDDFMVHVVSNLISEYQLQRMDLDPAYFTETFVCALTNLSESKRDDLLVAHGIDDNSSFNSRLDDVGYAVDDMTSRDNMWVINDTRSNRKESEAAYI